MESDPRDYILDFSGAPAKGGEGPREEAAVERRGGRPGFVSVYFRCCQTYSRIHLNAAKTAYAGHCPKCQRQAVIPAAAVGEGETIFQAE